jgi:hypothetical protein
MRGSDSAAPFGADVPGPAQPVINKAAADRADAAHIDLNKWILI